MTRMSERSSYFAGGNLGFAVALVIATLVGGTVLLGPGRTHLDSALAELNESLQRLETWYQQRESFVPVAAREREHWAQVWHSLVERVQPVNDDPDLMARVAGALQAPSVQDMQVERRSAHTFGGDEEAAASFRVFTPVGEAEVVAESVPMLVSFTSSYADAVEILSRLEARTLPARVDLIELKRERSGVAMRLELAYFIRTEGER